MWFTVGGKTFCFSIQEFCLIACLECGPDPPVLGKEKKDGSGSFRSSMLNDEVRCNNKTLETIFKAASSDSDEDMMKLALLYILEKMDLRKMSQECHTTSMKMVSNKKRKRQANKENDGIRQYALHGFPYAFQIWACEAIPAIGVEIANKYGTLLSRIVNWITPGTPDATNVIKLLDRKNLDPPEIGGEDEEDMLASNGFENDARAGAAENRLENASALHQQKSKRVCVDCKANNEENMRKLDALGKPMDQMEMKLDLIITLLGGEGKAPTEDQYNSKEELDDPMEVDGEKMDEKVGVDLAEEPVHLVVSKGEEKSVQEHFEAQVNVDVWKGEKKGVHEHFEAQVHVDDISDDKANKPAEKVYLPLNYASKHWILAEIDFIARKIIVYYPNKYY
ncbi:hypothetical protein Dsin_000926 [Dipteronia sinensis]|uniref:Ubiquitin-like protease family profile domain-containing protein n=1 Tax=Dipteronia sinensis TaxID=43782 RepID=A0AAE0EJU2_9ROSI|nr:hypothetical protein Dsin_000926 [Dipteronia sinensis]